MSRGFRVAPEDRGQIVEVAYMCAGDTMLRRSYDRSDDTVTYAVAGIEDDDWSWYETYEACNGAPPLTDWTPIGAKHAEAIIEEWS